VDVGDVVVEALGLDALGRLLPCAPGAWLVAERVERRLQIWCGVLEHCAQVLLAAERELRFELGGALAENLVLGGRGRVGRELALAVGGRGSLTFGVFEALALEGQRSRSAGRRRSRPRRCSSSAMRSFAALAVRSASARARRRDWSWSPGGSV
jgi:hypothetical protein